MICVVKKQVMEMSDEKEIVTLYGNQTFSAINTTNSQIRLLARAIKALYERGYNTFGQVEEVEVMLYSILGEKE